MIIESGDYSGADYTVTEDTQVTGGAWREANLINPSSYLVEFADGVPVHFLAVGGVRILDVGSVPGWLTVPSYHIFGDRPEPPETVSLAVEDVLATVDGQLRLWWVQTKVWIVANPTATEIQYRGWFVSNQDNTLFYPGTFLPMMRRVVSEASGGEDAWTTFRNWVLNNHTKEGFDGVF